MKILQLGISGKQQAVTCFSFSYFAFVLPSVGKTKLFESLTKPVLSPVERKPSEILLKTYLYTLCK
jgi:hypothetical protein